MPSKAGGKQKKTLGDDGSYDECAYCMNSTSILLLQCRYCHKVRYCDERCLNAHWSENHGRLCQPALFALSPDGPPPSSSSSSSSPAAPAPSPPPTLPVEQQEQPLTAGDDGSGGGVAEDSSASTSTCDTAVLAVLIAAGVEDAYDVARGLHAEAFDVETLRISSFDDVEEFGVVDEAIMQRIHDCLPPPAPPPSRE